jgi:hypothetical protein
MTTPSPLQSSELDNQLKAQYQGLTSELKSYFDTKQNEFVDSSKQSYSEPSSYFTDRGEFLVNNKIDDLDMRRREIWDFLTNEFNNNTREKYLNAQLMSQNKKDMARQKKSLEEYKKKYNDFNDKKNTFGRQKEIALYEYNRRKDQLFIMKVIGIVLIVCVVLTLLTNKYLPYETIYLVLLLFLLLILYIIYYIYFKNPGRSSRRWDHVYFKQPDQEISMKKIPDDFDYDKFDKKLDGEFNKYLDSCTSTNTKNTVQSTPSPVV